LLKKKNHITRSRETDLYKKTSAEDRAAGLAALAPASPSRRAAAASPVYLIDHCLLMIRSSLF
jgi:hypothetical protein